jgi:hypothetical protein
VNDKFVASMHDAKVVSDSKTLADFIAIWCDGHHRDRERRPVQTDGAVLGIYGRKTPVLCEECEAHLAYAEKRRAYCPEAPKPFCAYCERHCYRSDERKWQREMMRYSGPKSWRKGHAIDGLKHVLDGRSHRKEREARERASANAGAPLAKDAASAHTAPNDPTPTHQEGTR